MPRLDHPREHAGSSRRRSDPFRSRTPLHPRRNYPRWDQFLEAGSEANTRARGTLRLEGKDYIVQDGDVMHIRHSGYLQVFKVVNP